MISVYNNMILFYNITIPNIIIISIYNIIHRYNNMISVYNNIISVHI